MQLLKLLTHCKEHVIYFIINPQFIYVFHIFIASIIIIKIIMILLYMVIIIIEAYLVI